MTRDHYKYLEGLMRFQFAWAQCLNVVYVVNGSRGKVKLHQGFNKNSAYHKIKIMSESIS